MQYPKTQTPAAGKIRDVIGAGVANRWLHFHASRTLDGYSSLFVGKRPRKPLVSTPTVFTLERFGYLPRQKRGTVWWDEREKGRPVEWGDLVVSR